MVATDESVVSIEERPLTITTWGGEGAGRTVEDTAGRTVRVAVAADRAAFEDHFYAAIIGTSDPGIPEWQPEAVVAWDGATCTYDGPDPLPDELVMRIDNEGDEFVALVTGGYDLGTSIADLEAFRESAAGDTPEWWNQQALITVPTGAHDVWVVQGGAEVTAICFVDNVRFWELAGPRLTD